MSTRSNPFAELEEFFERMSRQFDVSSRMWGDDEWSEEFGAMAMDLVDRDEEFVVTVDMPGYEREDVEIRVTDHTLRIEAEREEASEEEDERYLRQERRQASAQRSVRLPADVDKENVHARMTNGVLTVTLPKTDVEEAQKIEIE